MNRGSAMADASLIFSATFEPSMLILHYGGTVGGGNFQGRQKNKDQQ